MTRHGFEWIRHRSQSWRVGELESWRVGELEIHAHLTAKKRHLSTGALRPGWDSNTLGTRITRNFDFGFEVCADTQSKDTQTRASNEARNDGPLRQRARELRHRVLGDVHAALLDWANRWANREIT